MTNTITMEELGSLDRLEMGRYTIEDTSGWQCRVRINSGLNIPHMIMSPDGTVLGECNQILPDDTLIHEGWNDDGTRIEDAIDNAVPPQATHRIDHEADGTWSEIPTHQGGTKDDSNVQKMHGATEEPKPLDLSTFDWTGGPLEFEAVSGDEVIVARDPFDEHRWLICWNDDSRVVVNSSGCNVITGNKQLSNYIRPVPADPLADLQAAAREAEKASASARKALEEWDALMARLTAALEGGE